MLQKCCHLSGRSGQKGAIQSKAEVRSQAKALAVPRGTEEEYWQVEPKSAEHVDQRKTEGFCNGPAFSNFSEPATHLHRQPHSQQSLQSQPLTCPSSSALSISSRQPCTHSHSLSAVSPGPATHLPRQPCTQHLLQAALHSLSLTLSSLSRASRSPAQAALHSAAPLGNLM